MSECYDYPVIIRWSFGKEGWAESGSLPPVEVAAPPEFGGPPGYWSPEHLFVSAVASCLMTTFAAIARNSNLEFVSLEVPAVGRLTCGEDHRYRMQEIVLRPRLVVAREQDQTRAVRILEKAHQGCLITNSIRSEVKLEPVVQVAHAPIGV